MSPIQSPRLETHCAIQSRKKALRAEDAPRRVGDRRLRGVGRDERRLALSRLLVGHPRLRTRSRGRRRLPGGRASSSRWPSSRGALLDRAASVVDFGGVAFFAARLAPAPSSWSPAPAAARSREQLDGLLEGDRVGIDAAGHGRVDGAVGDVGTEATVEHPYRRARLGVRAELGERRLRRAAAAPLLGLGEDRLAPRSSVTENSSSSDPRLRLSVPFLRYGP